MKNEYSLKLHRFLNRLLEPVLIVAIVVLVLVVLWQVFSRYVLQAPSTATDEIARFLLMWLTLLGAAWVVGQRAHLAIDLLSDKLSLNKAVKLQRLLVVLIALFALSVMLVGGISLVDITLTLEQSSTVLQVPMGYVYIALPVSGVFMLGFCICAFIEAKELLEQARKAHMIDNSQGDN
ncbi:TRAP transporter small permease [Ningiella sp. W23]|uniref:TRAP transporter small permease n=1 Tax=Ningiella sp. W23 TaxID=3023715 RepID=UPI003758333C